MDERVFYIVDVFAESKYTGNQLAVFRNGSRYSDSEMQRIAKEMNYSETTFIISDEPRNGGYDVRIFTPAEEVPFAGHPTLGTAFVILREIASRPLEKVVLNLTVGQIPVTFDYKGDVPDILWMQQKPPEFGETLAREDMAAALGLDPEDLNASFPVQEVSTGAPTIIAPLTSLEAQKQVKVYRYRLPKFKLTLKPDQGYGTPGRTLKVTVNASGMDVVTVVKARSISTMPVLFAVKVAMMTTINKMTIARPIRFSMRTLRGIGEYGGYDAARRRGGSTLDRKMTAFVDAIAQVLARFEMRHVLA